MGRGSVNNLMPKGITLIKRGRVRTRNSGFFNQCRDISNPGIEGDGIGSNAGQSTHGAKFGLFFCCLFFVLITWCLQTKLGAFCGGTALTQLARDQGNCFFPSGCLQEDQLKFHRSAMEIPQATIFNCPQLLFTLCW